MGIPASPIGTTHPSFGVQSHSGSYHDCSMDPAGEAMVSKKRSRHAKGIRRYLGLSWAVMQLTYTRSTSSSRGLLDEIGLSLEQLCPDGKPQLQHASSLYRLSQRLAGVPEGTEQSMRDAVLKFFAHSSGGRHLRLPGGSVISYVRVLKGGNNQIGCYMDLLRTQINASLVRSDGEAFREDLRKSTCIFTFVRDPMSHFISGYNEHQFKLHRSKQKLEGMKRHRFKRGNYLDYDKGSASRFSKFIEHILSPDDFLRMASIDGTVRHSYLMSGVLHEVDQASVLPSLVYGNLSKLATELPDILATSCTLSRTVLPEVPNCGQHLSSEDPHGTYKAARSTLHIGSSMTQSLCILLAIDYACFPQYLPSSICSGILGRPSSRIGYKA